MTKAKRYEGEQLRAEQWRNMGRDRVWIVVRQGAQELERIAAGKFNVYFEAKYDPMECGYLVETVVGPANGAMGRLRPQEPVFTHKEPALEFPSDHLKTKLLMLVG